jgi:hypothetical protein
MFTPTGGTISFIQPVKDPKKYHPTCLLAREKGKRL